MPHTRRFPGRRIAALIALLVPVLAIAAFFVVRARDDSAERSRAAVDAFAAAWTTGDDERAATLTDSRGAAAALNANRAGLDGAEVTVKAGPLKVEDGKPPGA